MSLDGMGYLGAVVQYASAIFFSVMALIFFLYAYRKGICSMDEEAKKEMMNDQ